MPGKQGSPGTNQPDKKHKAANKKRMRHAACSKACQAPGKASHTAAMSSKGKPCMPDKATMKNSQTIRLAAGWNKVTITL
ncbi:hypothetical protein [Vogesella sp. XCS3]|uniref:hypothetical protein n=1 Tax=Vogesella sp. XCS3 TaxID=2877939 RepID=UPI001D09EE8C|nr:hypothetical protein [Vogesella sp. XCS3]UDM17531.1 hypothetical protein LCH97_02305 [Vogesella sp. XCS3]